jgi:hypothetical protein
VACGYSQVPGIDLSESFAPVLNDVSFRIMLIAKLVWDMTSTVVEIETEFLHGDLDEEIYMEVRECDGIYYLFVERTDLLAF